MTTRSRVRLLSTMGVLVVSLALLGCPKRPEVMQAAPSPVGPPAAVAPAPTPPPAPPPVAETPVTPPSAPVAETPVTPPSAPAETPVQAAPPAAVPAASPMKDVFFDFDKSALREDQKAALNEGVAWLKENPRVNIVIEGHCDERGTTEYNIGLGERRAGAVKEYLVAAGIAAERIAAISYGKERPFVLGHDESAWKWNRRGHFVITGR
ncbi:MAG TPA: peptidoglycan-associated lipoprotein Pal [Candidatus Methylomirabilis sp.]|nr:peptidoglycan-associated lipoprotein Pal [Candidatus Methylomirabilis sp.]